MTEPSRHDWIVDALDADVARCEVDGHAVVHLPRWLLPRDARPGDALLVRHERDGEASRLEIVVRAAERPALPDAPAPGTGDITL